VYYEAKEEQLMFCGTDLINGRRQICAIKSDQIPPSEYSPMGLQK
jgi:hypothetical protein